jgi:hypothetical protein
LRTVTAKPFATVTGEHVENRDRPSIC